MHPVEILQFVVFYGVGNIRAACHAGFQLPYLDSIMRTRVYLFLAWRSLSGPDALPCVALWRPEALDCRVHGLRRVVISPTPRAPMLFV